MENTSLFNLDFFFTHLNFELTWTLLTHKCSLSSRYLSSRLFVDFFFYYYYFQFLLYNRWDNSNQPTPHHIQLFRSKEIKIQVVKMKGQSSFYKEIIKTGMMGNCHHELQVRNVIPKMVHRLRKVLKNLYVIYKFISIFSDIFFLLWNNWILFNTRPYNNEIRNKKYLVRFSMVKQLIKQLPSN